ncbi:FtsX-like permease family protein [Nakamurella deserti]|uniref:FtsX-like permease family protein n=1 Tax=Nakamurella deserti TaxID=2164074 RepID=UPI000DBE32A1|nr:FtsX family ABC transporter permease [Nakamurella deserti]
MRSAWAGLLLHKRRFAAVLLAIAIGVGFAASTLIFTDSFRTDLARTVGAAASRVDVIVQPRGGTDTAGMPAAITAVPGVAAVEPVHHAILAFTTATTRGFTHVQSIPGDPALRWFDLTDGQWPADTADPLTAVAVDADTAERNDLAVGSAVTVTTADATQRRFTVVGLLDVHRSSLTGSRDELYTTVGLAGELDGGVAAEFDVTAAAGTDPGALATAVGAALGDTAVVRTGAAVAAGQVELALGGTQVLGTVLLAFAVIAGLVASTVVANTFTILIHQRQRQIGLWRAIGASRRQVRSSVLGEALLIGVLGSLAGAPLAVGAALVAMPIAHLQTSSLTVNPLPLALSVGAGIGVTVIAALLPSVKAMKVSPLAALNLLIPAPHSASRGLVRTFLGVVMVLFGGGGLAAGVMMPSLAVAVGGGVVSALGVLLLLRSVLSRFLRLVVPAARLAGTPGRLAAANALRNPHRAAATATALTIAVGLIVTLQVAAASARASLSSSLDDRFPLDVSITSVAEPSADSPTGRVLPALPGGLGTEISGVDGLTTRTLSGTLADLRVDGVPTPVTAVGTAADVDAVIRTLPVPTGRIALPDGLMSSARLKAGDTVELVGPAGSLELTVSVSHLARGQRATVVIAATDLAVLDPAAGPVALWGRLADIDSANAAITALNPIVARYPSIALAGAAVDHASIWKGLTRILLLVTALLSVGAVIGVVGIGNTLGLAVTERTRESALLRALGLRRSQLRMSLAVEAALLATVGAVVGIGLGAVYGWVGAAATFGEIDTPLVMDFPTTDVLLVLAAAVLAGVAASVLPARRAARAQPRAVLAEI